MHWNFFLCFKFLLLPASGTWLNNFWWALNYHGVNQNPVNHKIQLLAYGKEMVVNLTIESYAYGQSSRLTLTWLPGTLMCTIKSLMAVRRSCRRRCGALCTSSSISIDSSRELTACSHCHSSLKQHTCISGVVLPVYSDLWSILLTFCPSQTHIHWLIRLWHMILTWICGCCP